MLIFSFFIYFLIILLLIIVIGTIQEFTLWCVTGKSHEFVLMILPALLSILLFVLIITGTYFILKLFNINSLKILYSLFMNWEYNFKHYIIVIISYISASFLFIILQSLCFKLININYSKTYNSIFKKGFKKSNDLATAECSTDLITIPTKEKIQFFYAISASLFSFAICFFSILLLIYIGSLIGTTYIT